MLKKLVVFELQYLYSLQVSPLYVPVFFCANISYSVLCMCLNIYRLPTTCFSRFLSACYQSDICVLAGGAIWKLPTHM